MNAFNEGKLNVLSIKNSSDNSLNLSCDIVIITSPICDNIIDIKKRFNKVQFIGVKTIIYKIYCLGTIEEELLQKQKKSALITIVDNNEDFIEYNENLGAVIL